MVNTILIEHSIRIIHPPVCWCVMILGTEFFAVGGVELVALLHVFPTDKVLHGACKSAIAIEINVQQQFFRIETLNIQRNIIVYLVYCQTYIERLHLLVICNNADVGIIFSLLNRQKKIIAVNFYTLHGMTLSQHLRLALC